MKLVSEQSDAEIAQHKALEDLTAELRALTANLMRISRGAGAPYRLAEQMSACLKCMSAYRAAAGQGVASYDLQEMLDPSQIRAAYRPLADGTPEDWKRWVEDGSFDREAAVDDIRRASLQFTASMLVDQLTHVRRAEGDLYDGARRLEAAIEKARIYREAGPKAPRKPRK